MRYIPYAKQEVGNDDIKEVVKALRSAWLTQGPYIKGFEAALCRYTGARYAVCVSSGTAALHLACLAAGIKTGAEAITSPLSFAASANCILFCGARPVFADIEKGTANIDCAEIEKKISRSTKAIIPVHFAGLPCEMLKVKRIADKNKLMVIEDACHALGARYRGYKVGSCRYSDLSVFSFHPVKTITTAEGGAILTNKKYLYERILLLRNHGITKESRFLKNNPGPWYYEMQKLGFNYRLSDMQAALGISQIKKIDNFIAKRRQIAGIYDLAFQGLEWIRPLDRGDADNSALHLYVVLLDFKKIKMSRRCLMESLKEKGILTQVHYIPIHLQPYYKEKFGYKRGDFPFAESYYDCALTLPMYPGLSETEQARVIRAVKAIKS